MYTYPYLDINTHCKFSIIKSMNRLKVLQIRIASSEIHKDAKWWNSYLQGPSFKITQQRQKTIGGKLKRREETHCVKGSSVNTKQILWKLDEVDSTFAG